MRDVLPIEITADMDRGAIERLMVANAPYRRDNSLVMVENYITACQAWLSPAVSDIQHGNDRLRSEAMIVQAQLNDAIAWHNRQLALQDSMQVRFLRPAPDWRDS